MHANNETGVIFPIEQLSRLTKETDPAIVFHTDATQSVGKLPIDLDRGLPYVDLLSFSGHKLHAPKGVGALYVKRGTPCRPLLIGGHQEEGRRAGTENVPYIVGLAKAVELAAAHQEEEQTRVRGLRDRLEAALERTHPLRRGQRQGRPAAAQHAQHLLPLRRRRGDALPAQRAGHLRLQRLGLHLRVAGALARAPRHERFLHGGPRLHPLQLQPLQHRARTSIGSSRSFPRWWPISAACRPIGTRRPMRRGNRGRAEGGRGKESLSRILSIGRFYPPSALPPSALRLPRRGFAASRGLDYSEGSVLEVAVSHTSEGGASPSPGALVRIGPAHLEYACRSEFGLQNLSHGGNLLGAGGDDLRRLPPDTEAGVRLL